jgi:hypothetical protein
MPEMRKYLWILIALGGAALLKKRADELGSWSAATDSLKADFAEAVENRGKPNQPSLWQRFLQRFFGSKKTPQTPE